MMNHAIANNLIACKIKLMIQLWIIRDKVELNWALKYQLYAIQVSNLELLRTADEIQSSGK